MDIQEPYDSNIDSISITTQELAKITSELRYKIELEERNKFFTQLQAEGKTQAEIIEALKHFNPKILVSKELIDKAIYGFKEEKYYLNKTNEYFNSLKNPETQKYSTEQYRVHYIRKLIAEIDRQPHKQSEGPFMQLLKHFTGEPKKGIIMLGPVGCGKTKLLKTFSVNPSCSFSVVSCNQIALEYKEDGPKALSKYFNPHRPHIPQFYLGQKKIGWLFDDLGTERALGNYGDGLDVMTEIILHWHNNKELWPFLNITTNLTPDQIEERYGLRVRSRIREMFEVIQYDNLSIDLRS